MYTDWVITLSIIIVFLTFTVLANSCDIAFARFISRQKKA